MSKVYVFLATGYEEIEALTVVDLLRRAGIDCQTVSVTGAKQVTSSHNVTVTADVLFSEITDDADMLVLPGGIPGTPNLAAHQELGELLKKQFSAGKWVAAVCAAPTVLGGLGILDGKKATCFPGKMDELICGEKLTDGVVVDGNVITSRGMGTCIDFGLKMIEVLDSKESADKIGKAIVYRQNSVK